MHMYNLIDFSDNYSKKSGNLCQYCKDIPAVNNNNAIVNLKLKLNLKLYVPVVTLSAQDNAKLLKQLASDFKREISWNKYLSKPELLARNPNLNHLVEPKFQGVKRLCVLIF